MSSKLFMYFELMLVFRQTYKTQFYGSLERSQNKVACKI